MDNSKLKLKKPILYDCPKCGDTKEIYALNWEYKFNCSCGLKFKYSTSVLPSLTIISGV